MKKTSAEVSSAPRVFGGRLERGVLGESGHPSKEKALERGSREAVRGERNDECATRVSHQEDQLGLSVGELSRDVQSVVEVREAVLDELFD